MTDERGGDEEKLERLLEELRAMQPNLDELTPSAEELQRRSYMSSYAGQVNGASLLHEPVGEAEPAETRTR